MFKRISEFLITGIFLIVGYLLYFVIATITTFILGLPIGLGIYTIIRSLQLLFNGV
jgi:uncharacterized membrane protein YccF (DUF307 family)